VKRLRNKTDDQLMKKDLEAMAKDPDIQKELQQINNEFSVTEEDGLKDYPPENYLSHTT
jgi:hypothetical protein